MTYIKSLVLSSFFFCLSFMAQAQLNELGTDKTLILTLQYKQSGFEIVNARLLNEYLPTRHTMISDSDDLYYGMEPAELKHNLDPEILSQTLSSINSNPLFETNKIKGATFIVRHSYTESDTGSESDSVTESDTVQTAQAETAMPIQEMHNSSPVVQAKKKQKVEGLPDQFSLSPGVKDTSEKPLYSDLI